jgi:hypothetical protein
MRRRSDYQTRKLFATATFQFAPFGPTSKIEHLRKRGNGYHFVFEQVHSGN